MQQHVEVYRHGRWQSSENVTESSSFTPGSHLGTNEDQVHPFSAYDNSQRSSAGTPSGPLRFGWGRLGVGLQPKRINYVFRSQSFVSSNLVPRVWNSSALEGPWLGINETPRTGAGGAFGEVQHRHSRHRGVLTAVKLSSVYLHESLRDSFLENPLQK